MLAMKIAKYKVVWTIFTALILFSCGKRDDEPGKNPGHISLAFEHRIANQPLVFDQMIYENEAGNQFLVNEIQYFISDVTLIDGQGNAVLLDAWEDILYVDTDLPVTHTHHLMDDIAPGTYASLKFTFGISAEKNQSLMFVNPPESLMFWPELLGGGYHYMKLNGKWLDTLGQVSPFNFHLGIGQVYISYPDVIDHYVQNHFEVILACPGLEVREGETSPVRVVMHVENWFRSPHTYDHNQWGGDIMQKQEAMHMACENGWDVFSCE